MTLRIIALILLSFSTSITWAQKSYTLKQCIEIAQKNNIVAQQAQLNTNQGEVTYNVAKYARLPNLNSSISNSYNFGRTIDPFTNAFVNQNVTAISMNLGSSVTLFNGFRLKNNIESARKAFEAGELNIDAINNNVALDVAALYLSALMAQEQEKTFDNNIAQTTEQLNRVKILLDAGATTVDRKYELEAQLSNDELQQINAKNNAQIALLNLKIYMNADIEEDFELAPIDEINFEELAQPGNIELDQVVAENFNNLPQILRDKLLLESTEADLSAANGNRLPSLTFAASVNSLYSSRSQIAENPRLETFNIGYVEGTNDPVLTTTQVFDYSTPGFLNQFENNFGQTFGFTMSIPIYNRYQVTAGIENAKINNQRQYLALQNTKNQVQNDIYQAYLAWQAAEKAYNAAEKAFESQKVLLEQTELRFNAGSASYFDYQTARNTYTNALVNLNRSKYDLLFKEKSFGFYLGNEITL
ncbi:MAG: TolC family protein [Bacteroidia bacterium]